MEEARTLVVLPLLYLVATDFRCVELEGDFMDELASLGREVSRTSTGGVNLVSYVCWICHLGCRM